MVKCHFGLLVLVLRSSSKELFSFLTGLSYQDRMTPAIRLLAFRLRKGLSIPNELTFGVHDQFILDLFLERLQQFQMTFQFF